MFNIAAPTCPNATCLSWPALAMLLGNLVPASAQDMPWRSALLTAASPDSGSASALSASLEVHAVDSHVQAAAFGDGRQGTELAGLNYRLWIKQGRADVGIGLGSLGHVLTLGGGHKALVGLVPTASIGMRYHVSQQHTLFADASGARGLGVDPATTQFKAKVGLEWKPARSTLGLEYRALGMQLNAGARLSLTARRGGPALYLRSTF